MARRDSASVRLAKVVEEGLETKSFQSCVEVISECTSMQVIVETAYQTGVTLLNELAVWAVEDTVVKVPQRHGGFGISGSVAIGFRGLGLELGGLFAVARVRIVERGDVGSDGERAVDGRVLRVELGLVKVVGVAHIGTVSS